MIGPAGGAARTRILFLSPVGILGGAERGLLNLATRLPPGYEARLLLGAPGPLEDAAAEAGIPTEVLPLPPAVVRLGGRASLGEVFRAAPAIAGYLRGLRRAVGDADLLWSNGIKMHALGAVLGLTGGPPLIAHLREARCPGWLRGLLEWGARLVVANSGATARAARLGRVPVRVVPNALPLRAMRRAAPGREEARAQLGLAPGDRMVLAVGALSHHKGQHRLVEAFLPLAARRPEAHLFLVGSESYGTDGHGGYRDLLEEQIANAGLGERVHLEGSVAEPWGYYAAADVFALPSAREGAGRAYLEAASFGNAVVATREGGPPEIFQEGEAILLDPLEIEAWAEALVALAGDPARCRELGRGGRAAARRHSLEALGRRLEAVLTEVRSRR